MTDDRRHITAMWVEHADYTPDVTGSYVETDEMFLVLVLHLKEGLFYLTVSIPLLFVLPQAPASRAYTFVRISAPASVISTVCSKWAAHLPSRVFTVQPSSAI